MHWSSLNEPTKTRSLLYFLCIGIAIQAIWGWVHAPLTFDELWISSLLQGPDYLSTILPTSINAHPLTNLFSKWSMDFLGSSPMSARLPGILFTGAFLTLLLNTHKSFATWTALLLALHLNLNTTFIWFSHSQRGYMALCVLIFASLFIFRSLTQDTHTVPDKYTLASVGILFCISPLVHLLGLVFQIVLIASFALWFLIHRKDLTPSKYQCFKKILFVLGVIVICSLPFFVYKCWTLYQMGWLISSTRRDLSVHFGPHLMLPLFGISWAWIIKLHLVLLLGLTVIRIKNNYLFKDWLSLCLILCLVAYMVCVLFTGNYLNARYTLPFLLIYTLWIGESFLVLHKWLKPFGILYVLLLFGYFPILCHQGIYESHSSPMRSFLSFVNRAKSISVSLEDSCIELWGDKGESEFAKIFFSRALKKKKLAACKNEIALFFPETDPKKLFLDGSEWNKIYSDSVGRSIYLVSHH